MIYLDTHVVAWLYAGLTACLSPAARDMINDNGLYLSPMVILELHHLHETGRAAAPGKTQHHPFGLRSSSNMDMLAKHRTITNIKQS